MSSITLLPPAEPFSLVSVSWWSTCTFLWVSHLISLLSLSLCLCRGISSHSAHSFLSVCTPTFQPDRLILRSEKLKYDFIHWSVYSDPENGHNAQNIIDMSKFSELLATWTESLRVANSLRNSFKSGWVSLLVHSSCLVLRHLHLRLGRHSLHFPAISRKPSNEDRHVSSPPDNADSSSRP